MSENLSLPVNPLTILHTSDWHLGRRLYGRMRYEEFEAFLAWLTETIVQHKVDVLIVAGDIFDTMTPSNRAQALYFEFLGKVSAITKYDKRCCQHIIIVAGNHDSPTFLDAPSNVLKFLNVHVVGTACDDLTHEVLTLTDSDGNPNCIVTAVPYLRDRDVRGSIAGESGQDKDASVIAGIRAHYDEVAKLAKAEQESLIKTHGRYIPIIATGHLFAAGGKTTEDDGVRDLYVGTLGKVSADMFDDCFDYVALGHLHVPQRVGGCEHIRYSGSPIAMGFGEARQQKQVLLIQFGAVCKTFNKAIDKITAVAGASGTEAANSLNQSEGLTPSHPPHKSPTLGKKISPQSEFMDDLFGFEPVIENGGIEGCSSQAIADKTSHQDEHSLTSDPHVTSVLPVPKVLHRDENRHQQVVSLPIPCFQKLAQVSGDLTAIADTIQSLAATESVWLEVIYDGDDLVSDLREHVQALVDGLPCEVLKIKNTRTYNKVLNQEESSETLQDLDELEVFKRCLNAHNIAESQRAELQEAYEQILYDIRHDDSRAQ